MTTSRKELILNAIEAKLAMIVSGNTEVKSGHVYQHTVSYVDRQYLVFDSDMIESHPKPWVILNNNGEIFGPLPGKKFENTIQLDVVAFISADESNPNLDTLMNSLQKDLVIAMLTDDNLSGLCDWITLLKIETVPEMIWPHGGFAISFEVTYHFMGLDL